MKSTSLTALLSASLLLALPAHPDALSEKELLRRMAVFGDDFLVEVIEAPVVAEPLAWVRREPGEYVYQYVAGAADAEGNLVQRERHVPDPERPDRAWKRHVGDRIVESFEAEADHDVVIVEEIDHDHGFRIVITPGVHWPAGIHVGDEFVIESTLEVFPIGEQESTHNGTLESDLTYEGAFRIRTPAGVFDTILIREDFRLHIGPLKAEDDRFLFYAKGIGLVAEIEAVRAAALIVFHMKEDSAKVLARLPGDVPEQAPAST